MSRDVLDLHRATGAGLLACKRALVAAGGDVAAATTVLRGSTTGREAAPADAEGAVASWISGDGRVGAMVELGCRTDFAARTPEFQDTARELARVVGERASLVRTHDEIPDDAWADSVSLYSMKVGGRSVADALAELSASLSEPVVVRRFERFELGSCSGI